MLNIIKFNDSRIAEYINEIIFLKENKNDHLIEYIDNYEENGHPCIITKYYKVKIIELKK